MPTGCKLLEPVEGERFGSLVECGVAPGPRRIPLPIPTTPTHPDRLRQTPAGAVSKARRSATGRSPMHPKISPSFPALFEEGFDRRRTRLGARRLLAEQRLRRGERRGLTMPSGTSRNSLPSGSVSGPVVTGSRRATGRPRSTIRTGDPPLRPSIRGLRLFFTWVTLAFFTKLN